MKIMASKLLCLLLFGGCYVGLWCGEVTCNKTDLEDAILDISMLPENGTVDNAENGSALILDNEEEIWINSRNGDHGNLSRLIPPKTINELASHCQALNISAACLESARRMNLLNKNKSDCGGILVHSEGDIKIKSFSRTECKWLVCNDDGMFFRFLPWDAIDYCGRSNYINVCDGCAFFQNGSQMENGTRHRFCGLPRGSEFVTSNQMIIIEAKNLYYLEPVLAHYQILKRKPDCVLTSHNENGTITNPEYPDSHPSYMWCKWKINAPAEYRIIFTVTDFRMGCPEKSAFLQIWDGTYEEYPMITRYSADNPPPLTLTSNSNSVTISSYIHSCNNISRFKLTWKFTPSGCNETLRVSSGIISSPRFRDFGKSGLFCNWTIVVNQGNTIRLVFLDFWVIWEKYTRKTLNCNEGYVEIANIDGNDISKVKYCKRRNNPGAIYTTGNAAVITVVMSKNVYMDKTFRLRFRAGNAFETSEIRHVCGTTVVGYKGIIESINYPHLPPPHLNCKWTISAPNHGSVFINLTHVGGYLKSSEPEGDLSSGEIGCFIERFNKNTRTCLSSGKTVLLEFKTSNEILDIGTGFRMEWEIRGCVTSINNTSGNFQSPRYPDHYPVSKVCEWTISTESGSGVELTIHDWEIENSTDCKFDGLKVFTQSLHVSQLLLHLCGTSQYPTIVTTQLNKIYVQFYSDESLSFKGFNVSFKQIAKLGLRRNCGEDHFGQAGYIYSPNFPNPYNNLDKCRWTITVHPNYLAAIKILQMDTPKYCSARGWDSLNVHYDKVIPMLPPLAACGAKLKRDRGIILSPDFLSIMNGAGNCNWTIVATASESRILLLFTEFYWSVTDPNCDQHFIEILDDNNTSLYRGCCSNVPPVTLGNTLILRTTNAEDLVFKAFYFTVTEDCVRILRENPVSNMTTSIQNAKTIESELECQQTLHSTDEDKQKVIVQFQLYRPKVHGNICRTNFIAVHGKDFSEPPTNFFCLQGIPSIEDVTTHYWTVYITLDGSDDGISPVVERDVNLTNLLLEKNLALSGTAAQNGKLRSVCMLVLYLAIG